MLSFVNAQSPITNMDKWDAEPMIRRPARIM
jgi:hypothetical protein